jgi:hypothetical protein
MPANQEHENIKSEGSTHKLAEHASEQAGQNLLNSAYDIDKSSSKVVDSIVNMNKFNFDHWQDQAAMANEFRSASANHQVEDLVKATNEKLTQFTNDNPTFVSCFGRWGMGSCSTFDTPKMQIGIDPFMTVEGGSVAARLFLKSDVINQKIDFPAGDKANKMSAAEIDAAVNNYTDRTLSLSKNGLGFRKIDDEEIWRPFGKAALTGQIDELAAKINTKLAKEEFFEPFGTHPDSLNVVHANDEKGKHVTVERHQRGTTDTMLFSWQKK